MSRRFGKKSNVFRGYMNIGKRIIILGSAGSGKSTLAVQLSKIVNLPVVHLDNFFWTAGWVSIPKDEMYQKVAEAASEDNWIIDGNYSGSLDLRIERADTIIFIDFNRYFCIYRVIKRRIKNNGKARPDLAEGCIEKIDKEFLKWIWNYPKHSRPAILEKLSQLSTEEKNIYILKSRKAVKMFINKVESNNFK